MTKLRVLDLFSGIGGFSLGLERTGGFETVAFCEIEPYCRKILAKHWPGVKCYDDVRTLTAARLAADGIAGPVSDSQVNGCGSWRSGRSDPSSAWQQQQPFQIDVITGGFPCQDISFAGKGAGIEGERSGLWGEYARLIGELRPRYVIVENVAALLVRGLGRVLGDMAEIGYDAEWHCIPAAYVGAPHRRDRIWIVAYPLDPDADHAGSHRAPLHLNGDAEFRDEQVGEPGSFCEEVSAADAGRHSAERHRSGFGPSRRSDWWLPEPDVGRVAHGVPNRVDRLKGLGNAVVPQIPELIGRAILAADLSRREAAE